MNKEKNNNPNEDFDQPSFLDQGKLYLYKISSYEN